MNKSGKILLTQEEFSKCEKGEVPQRLRSDWGISSSEELNTFLSNNLFEVVEETQGQE